MANLKYIEGNLFESTDPLIVHGVNCRGGFGAGVAGQIARLYPGVRDLYHKKFETLGWHLGDVQFVRTKSGLIIGNLATQKDFGKGDKVYINYEAFRTCLVKVMEFMKAHKINHLSMPKIGAGLAGGDWNVIEDILLDVLDSYPDIIATVYYI